MTWVRALTALRRVTRRTRGASTVPVRDFGTTDDDQVPAFLARARQDAARRPAPTADRLAVLLSGLERATGGQSLTVGQPGEHGPFLGWTTQRHWILDAAPEAGHR
jgi:hypothetical protein